MYVFVEKKVKYQDFFVEENSLSRGIKLVRSFSLEQYDFVNLPLLV